MYEAEFGIENGPSGALRTYFYDPPFSIPKDSASAVLVNVCMYVCLFLSLCLSVRNDVGRQVVAHLECFLPNAHRHGSRLLTWCVVYQVSTTSFFELAGAKISNAAKATQPTHSNSP